MVFQAVVSNNSLNNHNGIPLGYTLNRYGQLIGLPSWALDYLPGGYRVGDFPQPPVTDIPDAINIPRITVSPNSDGGYNATVGIPEPKIWPWVLTRDQNQLNDPIFFPYQDLADLPGILTTNTNGNSPPKPVEEQMDWDYPYYPEDIWPDLELLQAREYDI